MEGHVPRPNTAANDWLEPAQSADGLRVTDIVSRRTFVLKRA